MHTTLRRSGTRFDSWRGHSATPSAGRTSRKPGVTMARDVFYRQCRLVKRTATGEIVQVSWLPEPHAAAGRVVKLREDDGSWDDGWVVTEAGSNRLASDQVPDFHQLSKAHLRATGDTETAR